MSNKFWLGRRISETKFFCRDDDLALKWFKVTEKDIYTPRGFMISVETITRAAEN